MSKYSHNKCTIIIKIVPLLDHFKDQLKQTNCYDERKEIFFRILALNVGWNEYDLSSWQDKYKIVTYQLSRKLVLENNERLLWK